MAENFDDDGFLSPNLINENDTDTLSLTVEEEDELLKEEPLTQSNDRMKSSRITFSSFNNVKPKSPPKQQTEKKRITFGNCDDDGGGTSQIGANENACTNTKMTINQRFRTNAAQNLLLKRKVVIIPEAIIEQKQEQEIIVNIPPNPPMIQASGGGSSFTESSSLLFAQSSSKSFSQSLGKMSEALEDAAIGIDNDYMAKLREQEEKRKEIERQKEMRRFDSCDERLENVRIAEQLLGRKRKNQKWNETSFSRPKRSVFDRLAPRNVDVYMDVDAPRDEYLPMSNILTQNQNFTRIKSRSQHQTVEMKNENEQKIVLIKGLAPTSNEYSISALCQTIGPIKSCGIILENGQRVGRAEFCQVKHAYDFKNKYDGWPIDGSQLNIFIA